MGEIKIVQQYFRTYHIFNLSTYEEAISTIGFNLNQIKQHATLPLPHTLTYGFEQLKINYNQLVPHHMIKKRGLANLLGSGLKFVTGVMDDNDRIEIQSEFELVKENYRNIINNSNKQTKINEQLSKGMENTVNHINDVQLKMTNKINEIAKNYDEIQKELQTFMVFSEIRDNIYIINHQIETIQDIILSSKLEMLPKNILTIEEIQKYNLTVESYPYIKSCVLSNEKQIITVISIPLFTENKYTRVVIEKIPNENNYELDTKIETVITYRTTVFQFSNNKIIIEKELKPYEDECISNLLNNKHMACNFTKNYKEEVKLVLNGIIVTKNLKETLLINNCNSRKMFTIQKNNLIKFKNCKISISDQKFENKNEEHYHIIPNVKRNITVFESSNDNFTLNEIKIAHIENTNKINEITYKNQKQWYTSVSLNVTVIAICFIVIFIVICTKHKKGRVNIEINKTRLEPTLKDGGVTYRSQSEPIPDVFIENNIVSPFQ